jgi:hypothetical protein
MVLASFGCQQSSASVIQEVAAGHPDGTVPHVTPAREGLTPADMLAQAKALRERAATECKTQEWTKCRATLDEARKLDEDGDSFFGVQQMRGQIDDGIATDEWEKSRSRPRR